MSKKEKIYQRWIESTCNYKAPSLSSKDVEELFDLVRSAEDRWETLKDQIESWRTMAHYNGEQRDYDIFRTIVDVMEELEK